MTHSLSPVGPISGCYELFVGFPLRLKFALSCVKSVQMASWHFWYYWCLFFVTCSLHISYWTRPCPFFGGCRMRTRRSDHRHASRSEIICVINIPVPAVAFAWKCLANTPRTAGSAWSKGSAKCGVCPSSEHSGEICWKNAPALPPPPPLFESRYPLRFGLHRAGSVRRITPGHSKRKLFSHAKPQIAEEHLPME